MHVELKDVSKLKFTNLTKIFNCKNQFKSAITKDSSEIFKYKEQIKDILRYLKDTYEYYDYTAKNVLYLQNLYDFRDFVIKVHEELYNNANWRSMINDFDSEFEDAINNEKIFILDGEYKANLSHWKDIIKCRIYLEIIDTKKEFSIFKIVKINGINEDNEKINNLQNKLVLNIEKIKEILTKAETLGRKNLTKEFKNETNRLISHYIKKYNEFLEKFELEIKQ